MITLESSKVSKLHLGKDLPCTTNKPLKQSKNFCFKRTNHMNAIAEFKRNEIIAGNLLGGGAFSKVYEVSEIKLRRWQMVRKERKKACQAKRDALQNGNIRLAIKQLKPSILKGRKSHLDLAVRGLISEARLLASLSHENIVKVHGVPSFGCDDISSRNQDGIFLVMEKLDMTMAQLLREWKSLGKNENRGAIMLAVKVNYALQIARALTYMHERRIIFRDVKPDNIGITGHTIKLFDFGLSRKMPKAVDASVRDECFQLSFAGTPRYMSPCIWRGVYNQKADVYSWSIVFHQMLTLLTPYENCDPDNIEEVICSLGERPKLGPRMGIPDAIQDLLARSWDHRASQRPTMANICEELEYLLKGNSLDYENFDEVRTSKSESNSSYATCIIPAPTHRNMQVASAA